MLRLAGKILLWLAVIVAVIAVAATHGATHNFGVLSPAGPIGDKERRLMAYALLLGLIVVIPVFVMLFAFAWRYREGGSKRARYSPDFATNRLAETIWWLVPLFIITILSVLTWNSSHQLDPFRPLASSRPALPVQVIALDWNWLFLYPKQHIATLNYLVIPTDTPVSFSITSDAPMNSFWIPQLGGQVYAMSGMATQLQLMATKQGNYYGSSANISGNGFASMHFMTHAVSSQTFVNWSSKTSISGNALTMNAYQALAQPQPNRSLNSYKSFDQRLFNTVMEKYMGPSNNSMTAMTRMQ